MQLTVNVANQFQYAVVGEVSEAVTAIENRFSVTETMAVKTKCGTFFTGAPLIVTCPGSCGLNHLNFRCKDFWATLRDKFVLPPRVESLSICERAPDSKFNWIQIEGDLFIVAPNQTGMPQSWSQ
nr:hypothetical protein [Planctopirus hydrillae]